MNIKTILALSLAANLFFVLSRTSDIASPTPRTGHGSSNATPDKSVPAIASKRALAGTQTVTNVVSRTFGWEAVESPDYREYIENLRSVGCPDETIRDIIIADVNKLYDRKKKEMRGKPKEYEFWKPGFAILSTVDSRNMEISVKLEKEKNSLLRALGIEPDSKNSAMTAMMNPMDAMLGFLDEGKKSRVMEMMMEFQAKMVKASEGGQTDPSELGKVQQGMEEAIASLLSAEEYLDFKLRFSPTANSMRQTLGGFDPTKEEFLTIFKLRNEFDTTHSRYRRSSETEEEKNQREEDEVLLKTAIQDALGKDRYADYEMSKDRSFRQAYSAAKRSKLGAAEAKAAWQMRKEAENRPVRCARIARWRKRSAILLLRPSGRKPKPPSGNFMEKKAGRITLAAAEPVGLMGSANSGCVTNDFESIVV